MPLLNCFRTRVRFPPPPPFFWAGPIYRPALHCLTARRHPAALLKSIPMQTESLRRALHDLLGIPTVRCDLAPESRGQIERDGIIVEKWIWTSEPGSRVPSVLYRPAHPTAPMPSIVITCGHGGSKSQWQYTYIPQLYARLGLACLVLDPIGEEERHICGDMGTRAHDPEEVHTRADGAGRLIMGKLVFDTMRGIDFLFTRSDIDRERVGVAGNSLGGAKASWMLALDTRLKLALVSGWALCDTMTVTGKFCTRVPNQRLRTLCTWPEFLSLSAPHCAVLILNGDADVIIDTEGDSAAWEGTRNAVACAAPNFPDGHIACWFEPAGGHRPYFGYTVALGMDPPPPRRPRFRPRREPTHPQLGRLVRRQRRRPGKTLRHRPSPARRHPSRPRHPAHTPHRPGVPPPGGDRRPALHPGRLAGADPGMIEKRAVRLLPVEGDPPLLMPGQISLSQFIHIPRRFSQCLLQKSSALCFVFRIPRCVGRES